jgi:hypothetical protein
MKIPLIIDFTKFQRKIWILGLINEKQGLRGKDSLIGVILNKLQVEIHDTSVES